MHIAGHGLDLAL